MIPESYKVDFSAYRKDLVEQGNSRLLSQFKTATVLKQVLKAYMDEIQELHTACIDLLEYRTLYMAEGEQLRALARIVGASLTVTSWTKKALITGDGKWIDTEDTLFHLMAIVPETVPATDEELRRNILIKIQKNCNKFSSIPEISAILKDVTGLKTAINRKGQCRIDLIVPVGTSQQIISELETTITSYKADDIYSTPFSATTEVKVVFELFLATEDGFILTTETGQPLIIERILG